MFVPLGASLDALSETYRVNVATPSFGLGPEANEGLKTGPLVTLLACAGIHCLKHCL